MEDISFDQVLKSYCGVDLLVPNPTQVELRYQEAGGKMPFPYWSKVWPSAVALTQWLIDEPELVEGKVVLELGAGLGLPSLAAAPRAKQVTISDHIPSALAWIELNVRSLQLQNVTCRLINWHLHEIPLSELLLMSDVGYHPADFERLQHLISAQLQKGGSILLAVPERSVSPVFIDMVRDFQHQRKTVVAEGVRVILLSFYH